MESAVPKAARQNSAVSSADRPTKEAPKGRGRVSTWARAVISVILMIVCLMFARSVFDRLAGLKLAPPREAPLPPVLRVEVFNAARTPLQHYVSGFGTARADRLVVVSAEVGGRVTEALNLRVGRGVQGPTTTVNDIGQSVRHDATLVVRIDPQTYEQRVTQAIALLDQDKIALELLEQEHQTNLELLDQQKRRIATVERDLQRRKQLLASGGGMEIEVERATLELEQYRETLIRLQKEIQLYPARKQEIHARIQSRESDLRLAELELEKATIRAPFDGTLSNVFVEEGQYVRPGDQLVEVTDLNKIEVPIPMSLEAASEIETLIRQGATPHAELAREEEDFFREGARLWYGRVTRIAPRADQRTRTVDVFVEVLNAEQVSPLRPGAFVYARVEAGIIPTQRGILVPRDAIVDQRLFVARPLPAESDESDIPESVSAVAEVRDVKVRETYQTFALIESGVEDGERVVMTNLDIIRPGVFLNVRREHNLEAEFQRLRVPYLKQIGSDELPQD